MITGSTPKSATIGSSKVVVPDAMYKLLVWCDKGKLHAEYIYTKHQNTVKVSIALSSNYSCLLYRVINKCSTGILLAIKLCAYFQKKEISLVYIQCDAVVSNTSCQCNVDIKISAISSYIVLQYNNY